MTIIRPAAVAGMFYPAEARTLEDQVRRFLAEQTPADTTVPKAIIAPHAGYVYSGAVAAAAYARLLPARGRIKRVVLLGPCHRVAVRGLALSGADAFATPLGPVPVDKEAASRALSLPQVSVFDATHTREHSLEVHLPFLQVALGDIAVVPLVVGDADTESVAEVLDLLWGGEETLIVVSSDLSHFLDYDSARRIDDRTRQAVEGLAPDAIGRDQACGRVPMRGLLALARRRGLTVSTVGFCNSGDTAGDRDRVVGYGAWTLVEPDRGHSAGTDPEQDFEASTRDMLKRHGATIMKLAAFSIRDGLESGKAPVPDPGRLPSSLRGPGASFVTLKAGGVLRGCIGSYVARRPLATDICEHAFNAAFKDPRFPPLTDGELAGLTLSISVLSPQAPLSFTGEGDLLRQLRPGRDGLAIADGDRRALFLPAVWESLPEPQRFLSQLKVKAGLTAEHWSPGFRAWRFSAESISSNRFRDADSLWTAPLGKA